MYAAEAGNLFAVRLLLQQGANRNTKNKAGKTAFDIAFEEGEKDVVNELTEVAG
jgi:ankyrin repeat protein